MKILTIFLIAITLLSVITKETKSSTETSEKNHKTEDKKSESKNLKTENKIEKTENKSKEKNSQNLNTLFPVSQFNIDLRSLPHYEVNKLK
jgi:sortase (surface protein transpeptidase)